MNPSLALLCTVRAKYFLMVLTVRPHQDQSLGFGLPKASLRVAYLRLERGSIKCFHTIPVTFVSDPELEIELQIAE